MRRLSPSAPCVAPPLRLPPTTSHLHSNRCNSQLEHFHLQAVALPAAAAAGCRAAFEQHGAQKGIRFELLPAGPTALRDAMPRLARVRVVD